MADVINMNTNSSFAKSGTVGFGSYSEGAADDVNKALWAAMYLEPSLSAENLISQVCVVAVVVVAAAVAIAAESVVRSGVSGRRSGSGSGGTDTSHYACHFEFCR